MEEPPQTSESLITRVKNLADAESWTEFAAIYRPVIVRQALRRGLQQADAEDIAQKVLIAVSGAIGRWEPKHKNQPFRAWLGKMAHNAVLNALTRCRPDVGAGLSAVANQLNEIADNDSNTTAELLLETRREVFRRVSQEIRGEFSTATWTMFWETEVNGKGVAEVAAATGRSAGAVYVARCRVMNRLRERAHSALAQWGVDDNTKGHHAKS